MDQHIAISSECDTERSNKSQQEKDSDQASESRELVNKKGSTSVAWMSFCYEKSDMDQETVFC